MWEFLLGLALGSGLGLSGILLYRRHSQTKLRRLLSRLEEYSPLPAMGYDAQLASGIGELKVQIDLLSQQRDALRQLLKNAPVGYLQVDDENCLLWCNHRAQEFLDIAQGDYAQPRLLLAVVRSYELDQLIETTRQLQKPCQSSWTFNSISTDPFNYRERPAYPLQGYGWPLSQGHVGVFLENRQEAIALAQQRDRWISDVAHELKTPLTSIRLVAETLQSRIEPALLTWVERLLKEVIRLSQLVDDVLNMSRLEQGQTQLEGEKETDLVPLVQAAWLSLEPLAQLKQLQLAYDGPQALHAMVNASLMHRVLFNLLSNAVKYSPPNQAIQVRMSLADAAACETSLNGPADLNSILIEVVDAGEGLADKDLPHVFNRFYRADPARAHATGDDIEDLVQPGPQSAHALSSHQRTAREANSPSMLEIAELSSSGTGLGLAIVRQIVELHQGWVEAKNDHTTGGGWFRVWLPSKRLVCASRSS